MAINEVTIRRLSNDIKKAYDSQIPKKIKGKFRADMNKKNKKISRLLSEAIGKFILEAEIQGKAEGLVRIESIELGTTSKIKWTIPVFSAGYLPTGFALGTKVIPKFKNVKKPHTFQVRGKVVWQGKKSIRDVF
jgi:hypothetical protein